MIMNESQSSAFVSDTVSMDFESKEIYELNDSRQDIAEAKGCNECRNHKAMNEHSMDDANETVDLSKKEGQNGLSPNPSCRSDDADSLSSDTYHKEEQQRSQEHECLMAVEEHIDYNESKSKDSSHLLQMEANSFADKSILDLELPELEVCYKEIDQHVVKDICVDEGMPDEKGSTLVESGKDDKTGHFHYKAKEESFDKEILASDEENISMLKNANDISVNEEKMDSRLEPLSNTTSTTDVCKHDHAEDSVPTGKAAVDSVKDNTIVDKKIPAEELGSESFHKPLDGEENSVKQWPAQIADEEKVSPSLAVALVTEEVETLNFTSPGLKMQTTDDVKEPSYDSGETHKGEDKTPNHLSNDVQLGNKAQRLSTDHAQAVEPNAPKNDHWTPDNASVLARSQKDEGETSFSAVSLINYSEPLPFSGSLSHRSDSSATSARSFAFPVLQSEWNSSPVRMAKAERRHMRKDKCWRSGLFCCRF